MTERPDGWYIEHPSKDASDAPQGTIRYIKENKTCISWLFDSFDYGDPKIKGKLYRTRRFFLGDEMMAMLSCQFLLRDSFGDEVGPEFDAK